MKYLSLLILFCILVQSAGAQDSAANKKSLWTKMKELKERRNSSTPSSESSLPIDEATGKVSFKEVVESKGASKTALFERAKKWQATKGSKTNPYTVTLENEEQGSLIAKGTFTMPAKRKKYVVQFVVNIATKQGKYRYDFTDFTIALETQAGGKAFGYGGFGTHSIKRAETLEYTLETFYPSRLTSREPVIKYFEEIDEDSFTAISKEMQSLAATLKQSMSTSESDW